MAARFESKEPRHRRRPSVQSCRWCGAILRFRDRKAPSPLLPPHAWFKTVSADTGKDSGG